MAIQTTAHEDCILSSAGSGPVLDGISFCESPGTGTGLLVSFQDGMFPVGESVKSSQLAMIMDTACVSSGEGRSDGAQGSSFPDPRKPSEQAKFLPGDGCCWPRSPEPIPTAQFFPYTVGDLRVTLQSCSSGPPGVAAQRSGKFFSCSQMGGMYSCIDRRRMQKPVTSTTICKDALLRALKYDSSGKSASIITGIHAALDDGGNF